MTNETEIDRLRDERLGKGKCCKNCACAYPTRLQQTDLKPTLMCRAHPPAYQFVQVPAQGGALQMVAQHVQRPVADDYFCHCWRTTLQSVI